MGLSQMQAARALTSEQAQMVEKIYPILGELKRQKCLKIDFILLMYVPILILGAIAVTKTELGGLIMLYQWSWILLAGFVGLLGCFLGLFIWKYVHNDTIRCYEKALSALYYGSTPEFIQALIFIDQSADENNSYYASKEICTALKNFKSAVKADLKTKTAQ